ncbi:MAG: DnaJ domain-containing protein [Rubrivivax sp.]|nr:DnaJ domain-containing protein [Rubrivivax sp.]
MTDPYRQLGVPETADDDTIRAAYLAAIRACPPERDRHRFEQVRAAFEAISSESRRHVHALFDTQVPTAQDLLECLSADWRPGHPGEAALLRALGGSD